MPAPPSQIRIKRKATDDPVDLLCVHSEVGGLQQIRQYVFKRQRVSVAVQQDSQAVATLQSSTLTTGSPQLGNAHEVPLANTRQDPPDQASTHAKQEGDRESQLSTTQFTTSNSTDPVDSTLSQNTSVGAPEPRRFHLSRTGAMQFTQSAAGVRGQKAPIAVFVEKKKVSRPLQTTAYAAVSKESLDPNPPAPLRNVKMPSGKTIPWDVRPEELAAEMEAYILGEIGRNITETTSLPAASTKKPLRFKPRACAGRLSQPPSAGRAPVPEQDNSVDIVMTDATEETDNNSSYIIDTYVRMPAEMFPSDRQTQNVGLLVLETQPDIDEFYDDCSDQESETYCEGDEDENAENHPSTDYPEDELESDDEYDRNPYKYYHDPDDDDGVAFSDDEDDEETASWRRSRPWMTAGGVYDSEEDEGGDYD